MVPEDGSTSHRPLSARIAGFLDGALLAVCITILLTLAAIIVVAIFSRKLGASLAWYDEAASYLLAWLTYFGAAFAALRGAHLEFGVILQKLPVPLRMVLFSSGRAIGIAFFAVMAYAGWVLVELMAGETLVSLEWMPRPVAQAPFPIGAVLYILADLLTFPADLRKLCRGITREDEEIARAIEEAEAGS